MEKDIELLEKFINNKRCLYARYSFDENDLERLDKAILNLLTRYKELEEENKKLKKHFLCETFEPSIKITKKTI